jgi:hypothetical protein
VTTEEGAVPGEHLKGQIRREVLAVLVVLARGRENALTGERLAEAVAARLLEGGHEHHLSARTMQRRCQEPVAELIEVGEPIASSSKPPLGYWWAVSSGDLEESLAESDKRARKALRRRRLLRRAWMELLGQERLRERAAT